MHWSFLHQLTHPFLLQLIFSFMEDSIKEAQAEYDSKKKSGKPMDMLAEIR
jgi:hypothetical protein